MRSLGIIPIAPTHIPDMIRSNGQRPEEERIMLRMEALGDRFCVVAAWAGALYIAYMHLL